MEGFWSIGYPNRMIYPRLPRGNRELTVSRRKTVVRKHPVFLLHCWAQSLTTDYCRYARLPVMSDAVNTGSQELWQLILTDGPKPWRQHTPRFEDNHN